jgi:ElaB/YqjD/DUF883 family membrane-anchored ribosome-binding protein
VSFLGLFGLVKSAGKAASKAASSLGKSASKAVSQVSKQAAGVAKTAVKTASDPLGVKKTIGGISKFIPWIIIGVVLIIGAVIALLIWRGTSKEVQDTARHAIDAQSSVQGKAMEALPSVMKAVGPLAML